MAKQKQTFPLFPYWHRRRKRGKAKTNVPTIPIRASAKETWQSENKRSHYSHTGIGEGNVAKRKQTFPLFPYWHRRRKRGKAKTNVPTIPILASAKETSDLEGKLNSIMLKLDKLKMLPWLPLKRQSHQRNEQDALKKRLVVWMI